MPIGTVLEHTAWPVRSVEEGPWVDGERDVEPTEGAPFDCALFLPLGEEPQTPRGGRSVKRPTLLYEPEDRLGAQIELSHEDELLIVAEELNVAEGREEDERVRWQVNGAPQPFGRPGAEPVGFQAALVRVDD